MQRFILATYGLILLLAAAMLFGAPFPALALAYVTVFAWFLDRLSALAAPDHPGQEFPAGDGLAVSLALAHFPLLFGGVWTLAQSAATKMDKALIFLALSLFIGQVGNSNAHELIHRGSRSLRRLGVAVYTSILFGHHASAHVRVHHVHAATPRDPNSARPGESFYAFALRAWVGAFRAGYRADSRLRRGAGLHPYVGYLLGAAASLSFALMLAGPKGVAALIAISAYAQAQLLLSDYVQHYGLQRCEITPGRVEPVGLHHSWNAPHSFTSSLMLNAPRHSDHHAHPAQPYPGLEIDRQTMPILPYSLPTMAVIALIPPLWRRIMDPRARKWAKASHRPEPAYG
ncbi:alkane 1-monooxygenase [Antarctobacter heliothermus]|uniref:Alkane 1-monooxygenase n=1 Tax=Antarctobacter heliothermus TaxID=74033 RepID=A0A239B6I5_9RHOB|nr:alkane 1-monooxygenase [Antarctobacter heliothermus]SNS02868.1 alkane 1-monooxygenase [Antarctobacter heliothermus]